MPNRCSCSIKIISQLKVEKVVNPPQTPTIKSNYQDWLCICFDTYPINNPIKKLPIMLTEKVANGNFLNGNSNENR